MMYAYALAATPSVQTGIGEVKGMTARACHATGPILFLYPMTTHCPTSRLHEARTAI